MTWRADLQELSDNALLARLRPLPPGSAERAAICEVLIERHAHLVRACVRPYRASPEPASEDQDPAPLSEMLGADDQGLEHATDMEAVRTHLDDLPAREQRILNLRFYGNLTQAEIGQRLGLSQMHVSRLLARTLAYLRHQLTSEPAPHRGCHSPPDRRPPSPGPVPSRP